MLAGDGLHQFLQLALHLLPLLPFAFAFFQPRCRLGGQGVARFSQGDANVRIQACEVLLVGLARFHQCALTRKGLLLSLLQQGQLALGRLQCLGALVGRFQRAVQRLFPRLSGLQCLGGLRAGLCSRFACGAQRGCALPVVGSDETGA